ncbi:sensor histidine kinase [Thermomonospora cellulosilytica]|uniref:histidine kinase n=1 Tax=Thermomonospora cellulosilytica TaxID=1411118 RepID=A0A7W3N5A6_9ACTN|nr:sensor histidine kinase [Thermomonospora cellulosilytica]MBA9007804.1 signal transduction histidine kinase [Thermomonospora cellulosilytica]
MNVPTVLRPFLQPGLRPRDWPVWVVPLLLGVFVTAGSFGAQRNALEEPHAYPTTRLDAFAVGLLAAGAAALLARRRFPAPTAVVVGAVVVLYLLRAYPYGPVVLLLSVAVLALVVSGHRIGAWAGTITGFLGYCALTWLIGLPADLRGTAERLFPVERPTAVGATIGLLAVLVSLTGSELVRISAERAAEAESRRRELERRRASEERLRIARELHDVLAHNISMINVQAGVALHLIDERPEQARTALAAIKEASKEALTEMRQVIGVLRQQGETAPRSPAAGLDRLPELLDRARAAGLTVHAEVDPPPPGALPAGTDLAVFRIVQESLTNVTRHAGPGPVTVWVRVSYGERGVFIRVDDDGRGAALLAEDTGGSGLAGMRERAAALGGELSAGPRPGGGFRVTALLPAGPAGAEER